jgi:hypothetical protein
MIKKGAGYFFEKWGQAPFFSVLLLLQEGGLSKFVHSSDRNGAWPHFLILILIINIL